MPLVSFGTLQYATRLIKAGVPDEQQETELKNEIAQLRAEMKSEFAQLRAEIRDTGDRLIAKLDALFARGQHIIALTRWMFGILITTCLAIAIRLFFFSGP